MQPGHNEAAIVFWEGFPETKPCHEAVVATRSGVSFKADSGRALRLGGFATIMFSSSTTGCQDVERVPSNRLSPQFDASLFRPEPPASNAGISSNEASKPSHPNLWSPPISILGRVHMFQIASHVCSIMVLTGLLGRQRLRTVRGSEQREA